jgi:phosphohistidine phosphatase
MKNLILLRHAKSSWKDPSILDFDRPLSNRGKNDAPIIAEILKSKNIKIDLIISSGSKRTADTAEIFAERISYSSHIRIENKLYEATAMRILEIIKNVDELYSNLLLVAHNPGITQLANFLTNSDIENIPTTGLIGLSYKSLWKNLDEGMCTKQFFEYPKKYKKQ